MSFAEMVKQEVEEAQAERSIKILKKFFGQNRGMTFAQLKDVLSADTFLDESFGKIKLEEVVRIPMYREKVTFERRLLLADKLFHVIKSSKTSMTRNELIAQVEESELVRQVFGSLINILLKAKRVTVDGKGKMAKFGVVAVPTKKSA